MTSARWLMALALTTCLCAAGCHPELGSVGAPCSGAGSCPAGQRCGKQGRCVVGTADAGEDANKDGPLPDACDGPRVDAHTPDQPRVDAQQADLPSADLAAADGPMVDLKPPDLPAPDLPAPDLPMPDLPAPDLPVPDLPAPDLPAPDLPAPDVALPDQWVGDGPPPGCGDAKKAPTEDCDGKLLGGATCAAKGYTGGVLACTSKCQLDTSGCYTVLDPGGFAVATGKVNQHRPRVGYAGSRHLVVWQEDVTTMGDILGRQVDQAGKLVGSQPINISVTSYTAVQPAMASDGIQHYVAWLDKRNTGSLGYYNVFGTRVTAGGTVTNSNGQKVGVHGKSKQGHMVAASGSGYLVLWNTYIGGTSTNAWDIEGTTISVTGTVPLQQTWVNKKKDQLSPHAASDGKNYLVAWLDDAGTNRQVRCGLFKPDGKLIVEASVTSHAKDKGNVRVAYDGTSYLVVWADGLSGYHDVWGARVSTNGKLLDKLGGFPIAKAANYQHHISVARGAGGTMVVWHDKRDGNYDVYGALVVDGASRHGDGFPVVKGGADYPAVSWDGATFLVVWSKQMSSTDSDIYAARVSLKPKP